MTKFDKIRNLHNFFLKKFKPRKKVILMFKKMVNHGGYKYTNGKHYISLNKKDNLDTLCETYGHEYAHSLDRAKWNAEHHSDHWGYCYARAYRIYLKWAETFCSRNS